jgi:hypothetical protein
MHEVNNLTDHTFDKQNDLKCLLWSDPSESAFCSRDNANDEIEGVQTKYFSNQ